MYSTVLLLWVG